MGGLGSGGLPSSVIWVVDDGGDSGVGLSACWCWNEEVDAAGGDTGNDADVGEGKLPVAKDEEPGDKPFCSFVNDDFDRMLEVDPVSAGLRLPAKLALLRAPPPILTSPTPRPLNPDTFPTPLEVAEKEGPAMRC